ncbi:MAG: primosomal protein N', partial [Sediminibacterium sp.]|nr:primosomal protein N' [Sediminibacterium sp.]
HSKDILLKDLVQLLNNQISGLNTLIKKGIFIKVKKEVSRLIQHNMEIKQSFILSENQQQIYNQIIEGFNEKKVYLLHGVTGSGKTEIYIKLIEYYLTQSGQILLILPEIAITTQIASRLKKYFLEYIAIYHSKISSNERTEIWEKVLNDKVKIILGARSALFLPFTNLKFIIIDEEHDYSYKQTNIAPRYNAKDAAIFYGHLLNATVLLGSATPSLETMYQTKKGKYGYAYLANRFNNVALPSIEIIDLKNIPLREKIFSTKFIEEIEKKLMDKKQVILFHNRRGYAPYYFCSKCNFVPNCKFCNVSLTYHKFKNKLSCHYCGTHYPIIKICTACGSPLMEIKKFGTEQLEEAMQVIFPMNKIKRMDIDTM